MMAYKLRFIPYALAAVLIGLVLVEGQSAHPILSGSFMGCSAFLPSVLALFLTQGLMQANMTGTVVFVNYTQPVMKLPNPYFNVSP